MRQCKRIVGLMLVCCMVMSLLCSTVSAADRSGTCGANLSWKLENGILTISGNGPMTDWENSNDTVWGNVADITSIIIESGVTTIGTYAFSHLEYVTSVSIPSTVKSIGDCSFWYCTSLIGAMIPEGVTSIGRFVFSYCPAMKSISLPVSLKNASGWMIEDCNALTDAYYAGSEIQWAQINFTDTWFPEDITVHYNSSVGATPSVNKSGFSDVTDDSPFSDAVAWAVKQGITTGVTSDSFQPSTTCTNNHILTFLWRSQGKPASSGSTDFEKALNWAKSKGIVDSNVNGSAACTRGDAVTYMWKLAGSPVADITISFSDIALTDSYATAVAWALEKEITQGTDPLHFSPKNTCTRGQIVTFLYRAYG